MHALNCPTNAHIITWSPDGKSFIFIDRKAFEATILPVAFKDSKFASFLRKVSTGSSTSRLDVLASMISLMTMI